MVSKECTKKSLMSNLYIHETVKDKLETRDSLYLCDISLEVDLT